MLKRINIYGQYINRLVLAELAEAVCTSTVTYYSDGSFILTCYVRCSPGEDDKNPRDNPDWCSTITPYDITIEFDPEEPLGGGRRIETDYGCRLIWREDEQPTSTSLIAQVQATIETVRRSSLSIKY